MSEDTIPIEDMKQARERVRGALNIALDIYELVSNKKLEPLGGGFNSLTIPKDEIVKILHDNKSPPLSDHRMKYMVKYIGRLISSAVDNGGDLVLCDTWQLAHAIEHILWDVELPPL